MQEVVIAGYVRTAQSRSRPNDPERDWFHKFRADELLAKIIPEVLAQCEISSEDIDDFIVGSAMGVSEQWTFGGRTPVFLANLSHKVPAKFIDQQCGSGMAAIQVGYMEIATGFADMVLAAGMEHMTRVPIGPALFEKGTISFNDTLYTEAAYQHWDMETAMNMGLTAEKLAAQTGIGRRALDQWGARSHQQAAAALKEGFFKGEIHPVETQQADGQVFIVDQDQTIRENVSAESMAQLKPIFRTDGVVTAGNASPLNAGAAVMLLMSCETAKKRGIKPMATIRSIGFAGVNPAMMGEGPVPAVRMALKKYNIQPEDIDYWEINEAFSIVVLNAIRALNIDPERVNIMGGAIALGHPLGATGVRLVGTLARILAEKGGRFGCACACIGGGQGTATVIERET